MPCPVEQQVARAQGHMPDACLLQKTDMMLPMTCLILGYPVMKDLQQHASAR